MFSTAFGDRYRVEVACWRNLLGITGACQVAFGFNTTKIAMPKKGAGYIFQNVSGPFR